MTKARDIASASPAPSTVSTTELGYVDGVTSPIQTQIDSKSATSHNHDSTYLNQATIDAKGDLLVGTGNDAYARVAIGADGTVLTADSAQASGVSWAAGLPSQTGNSGKYLTTNGTTASWGTVTSLLPWTRRKGPNTNGRAFYTIAYNGSNLYVAAGESGQLWTSPDGITWTSRTSGFGTTQINKVRFGNNLWVAVGDNGIITTSSDGTTWTARTANMGTNRIQDVLYANGRWVACGDGANGGTGGITSSTDGITWTKATTPTTTGNGALSIAFGNGYWIVGMQFNTNNLLISTNGTTWSVGNTGSNIANGKVVFANNSFYTFFVGTGQTAIYRSTAAPYNSWSYVGELRIDSYSNSADLLFDYQNEFWWVPAVDSNFGMNRWNVPVLTSSPYPTSTSPDAYLQEYRLRAFFPISGPQLESYITAMHINTSNGFTVISDSRGRIYTAQF